MRRLAILFPLVVILAACATTPTTIPAQTQVKAVAETETAIVNLLIELRNDAVIDAATWNEVIKPLEKAAMQALDKAKARADAGDEFNARYYLTVANEAFDQLRSIAKQKGGGK